ncbi:MAG TPA: hypothetical protein VN282_07105 [Pyrinomonadaceae bacterium]|nr:hypothetical protein [Pyrinomonadaceae bacterium]
MYSRDSGLPFALYAYAGGVLARAAARRATKMTRDDAEHLLRSLADAHGVSVGRLFDGKDVAGVMLGGAELFFHYDGARRSLWCGALVYRFRSEPRPGLLEAFFEEEGEGAAAPDSGGALEYREATRSLLLARTYEAAPAPEEFVEDVTRLAAASLAWARDAAPRVASRVRD